jgi:hypothetical protein
LQSQSVPLFTSLVWILCTKKPAALVAGGLVFLFEISLALFSSGHGSPPAWGPMMMVVTVMAMDLHLELR